MPFITLDASALPTQVRQDAARAYGRYLGCKDAQGNPRSATITEIRADLVAHAKGIVDSNLDTERKEQLPPINTDLSG